LNATGEVLATEVLTDLVVEKRNVERADLLHGEELMSRETHICTTFLILAKKTVPHPYGDFLQTPDSQRDVPQCPLGPKHNKCGSAF
jgi:hypothetical protein